MNFKRLFLDLFLILAVTGCSSLMFGQRIIPRYKGVDPKLQPYVNDYLNLAKAHGIVFDKSVTIGFTDIKSGSIIGVTNYGLGFREIDIDRVFWQNASTLSKIALIWHETSHAYCDREHDYRGKKYKETDNYSTNSQGFYQDNCPKSILFPIISDDECIFIHFSDYENEIFENCKPY